MARPKELTKADKFYLDAHLNNDVVELAENIKNTQEVVQIYINEKKKNLTIDVGAHMIRKERNGESVAAIMTPNASMVGDGNKTKSRKVTDPSMIYNCKRKN